MVYRLWIGASQLVNVDHHDNPEDRRQEICDEIDEHDFDWQIFWVAGFGFLTDSYNLFSTNVILPSLAFIYWTDDQASDHETNINAITLTGSIIGQLLFGYLCDKYGRRKLYGQELIIVIFGTLGLVQCSAGYSNSTMSILGLIMLWRFLVGIGIGAEYPLSAVITAEFAPRRARARMMAAVFAMQPIGQVLAHMVGLVVLVTVGRDLQTETDHEKQAIIVDRIWRWIIGVGAIPALISIGFRLTIPESPRYTNDVEGDGDRAWRDAQRYYDTVRRKAKRERELEHGIFAEPSAPTATGTTGTTGTAGTTGTTDTIGPHPYPPVEGDVGEEELSDTPRRPEWKIYFLDQGNIKYLLGTSLCWFLLDLAFYGLGINNPRVIAQIWADAPITNVAAATNTPIWGNPAEPDLSIYDVLMQDSIRSIITVSIGSLLGSFIIIKAIDFVPRKDWLAWSFVGMAVLFGIVGGSYFRATNTSLHALTIVLYIFSQLLFNLGPNTLTYIIPAEIFPTRYRGTCHGIAAASGKFGSVIVQAFLKYTKYSTPNSLNLGWVLIGFSFAMALGAFFAWAWIPDVQNARGTEPEPRSRGGRKRRWRKYEIPSKSLEELARGRVGVLEEDADADVGIRHRGGVMLRNLRGRGTGTRRS